MLEKVLSSHVLWYNDEGVYIRASLESAHDQVKPECEALTRSIDPKAIAPESKYFAAGLLHNGLREILCLADVLDEFHSDLLYELKCGFSVFEGSAQGLFTVVLSTLPSLCLLQALEVILSLQLCNEGIVGSKLGVSGEVLRYWRCDTVFLGLIRRHDGWADASVSCSSVMN